LDNYALIIGMTALLTGCLLLLLTKDVGALVYDGYAVNCCCL